VFILTVKTEKKDNNTAKEHIKLDSKCYDLLTAFVIDEDLPAGSVIYICKLKDDHKIPGVKYFYYTSRTMKKL
jgi:hypothetical protein